MKKEERETLYNQKIAEGLSERQAWEEINQLQYSQKIVFKEKDNEIKRLKKELEKLEKQLEKKSNKSKDFKTQFLKDVDPSSGSERKIKQIKNSKNETKLATTKDLSRILSILECEKEIGLSDLTKTCALKSNVSKNALSFLSKNKFIELIGNGGTTIIRLK